ncbi:hypothetical protein SAMN05444008_10184 [Cnuella takakiae]|uniref:Uncharacterized protein n=1 Tax=Cnuella takakiae TaxID=1302690 RepID=A0A1M4SDH0_9BACT|nr:hypothetical protein [Cnuella takakiae]OLY94471.1 hypothetical protein BUE76_23280 [Cnuella takakiae]SHE30205.1 hypothetical protein SAMN05444008_10184 [Cnuella takakiae]
MKSLTSCSFVATLLIACADVPENAPEIGGVYVRQFESEFGSGWDTVFVDADPRNASGYVVRHHTHTIRKDDQQVPYPEQKEWVLPATWNGQDNVLISNRLGRRYVFSKKDVVVLGTAQYTRIGNKYKER